MKSSVKIAIIGGGIVGCSILYHLTRRGWSNVVLLERGELTAGSTWHAAASMHRLHSNPNIARLQDYSNALYRKLEAETGQSCGIHTPGGLYLASSRARMQELKIQYSRSKYLGFDVQLLSVDEIKQFNPLVDTEGLHGGMWDPEDGHVDDLLDRNVATLQMLQFALKCIRQEEPGPSQHPVVRIAYLHDMVNMSEDECRII